MRELALLGATASGKTSLAIYLATKYDGVILSLDSLSIYRGIDIASAKPSLEERATIKHFGVDVIYPNEEFNVTLFFDIYRRAKEFAVENNKMLIIVGGTSFYLKAMLDGLSHKPLVSKESKTKVREALKHLEATYEMIEKEDSTYAKTITKNDKYRIEKWLEIYYETKEIPSKFLKSTLQEPLIKSIFIYELLVDREELRENIRIRTNTMIKDGLIDEVVGLEKKYSRLPKCMKAIGIKEVLAYLDGDFSLDEMREKIITNTAQLAKRQRTFNKTQFSQPIIQGNYEELVEKIQL